MKAFVRKFFDLPYRIKLLITHLGIVLLVVVAITAMITATASRQVLGTSTASLVQLTEQVLINFTNAVQSAESHLYSMSVSSGSARQMGRMSGESALNEQDRINLVYCLSKMIDLHATYDHVAVRLDSGIIVSSDSLSSSASAQSSALLSDPAYQENRYGQTQWVRTESGDVWLLRDVYDTSPLRRVGKMCARMKQGELVSMGSYNGQLGCSVLFFSEDGHMIVGGGENAPLLAGAAQALLTGDQRTAQVGDTAYAVCRLKKQGFTAVGFLPMKSVEALQASILRSGVVAALLGVLFGLIISIAVSGQMTGQIRRLVDSMHRVEAGELDVSTPVQSRDEIGVLTGQFNRMTAKTRELVQKLVEEENSKRLAQVQNLAYEYRFLHWQVNPHFIYNALETLNALAKIDGNDEMSDMIVMLSAYFRQNAEAMRKKFVTVEEEFSSLQQYADIYRCIYGSSLHADFEIARGAGRLPADDDDPAAAGERAGARRRAFGRAHCDPRAGGGRLAARDDRGQRPRHDAGDDRPGAGARGLAAGGGHPHVAGRAQRARPDAPHLWRRGVHGRAERAGAGHPRDDPAAAELFGGGHPRALGVEGRRTGGEAAGMTEKQAMGASRRWPVFC